MRTVMTIAVVLALAWTLAVAPAVAAAQGPGKTYLLQPRPTVGQRIAYEQSLDTTLHIRAAAAGNHRAEQVERFHDQVVVTCQEIIEVGKPPAMSKRVTFGPQCWSATKVNDRPSRKVGSVYAGKTVLFRIFEDGALEQDFGVKPTKAQMQRLKNMFVASADLYPGRPVAVGERWRADRAMAARLARSIDDTSSTIFTLKEVREQDGREVAVIGVSAGVIKAHDRGFNLELSLEGTWHIDVETGAELKIDLTGRSTIAAKVAAARGKHVAPVEVQVSGDGTFEMHRSARLLGPEPIAAEDAATTRPTAGTQERANLLE